jgi:hypothetical protein
LFNLLFLVDTLMSDQKESFSIFSIRTSKTMTILYYSVFAIILIGAAIYYIKSNNAKKNNLK